MPFAWVHEYAPHTDNNRVSYQPKWTYEENPFSPPQPIVAKLQAPEDSIPYIKAVNVEDIITNGFQLIPHEQYPTELTIPKDLQRYC